MAKKIYCPVCSWQWDGQKENCPRCDFPIARFAGLLSGNPVIYDETLKKEFETELERCKKVWGNSMFPPVRTLKGHTGSVCSLAFSPDGKFLASGSDDKTIKIWRVSDGSIVQTLKEHTDWVNSIAFSPDGKLLASGSRDGTIRLWRLNI